MSDEETKAPEEETVDPVEETTTDAEDNTSEEEEVSEAVADQASGSNAIANPGND